MKSSSVIESMRFFADFTEAVVQSARVYPGGSVETKKSVKMGVSQNTTGITLIRPGGRSCYPAVWTQDFSLALATGFITPEEMKDHLFFIGMGQNGSDERHLKSGAVIPAHAIPDHILFDGRPVFYPGGYSSGEDQGGEPWGIVPPTNNHYDFIRIAWHLWQTTNDPEFLNEKINGLSVIERLRLAFQVPRSDPATGLVYTEPKSRAVGFIYCDSIYMTGHLLFASLLRWLAANYLADLEDALGNHTAAEQWHASVSNIPDAIPEVFANDDDIGGWLMAATEVGRQADVWGTVYALYLGLLTGERAEKARKEIVTALKEGTISHLGAVRHVPTNHDASPDSAWERTHTPHNNYQNGAYWHTPSGWLIAVLEKSSPELAKRIFDEMITHFREEDFRKGVDFHAPWECLGKDGNFRKNPLFLDSAALPFGVLKQIWEYKK